MGFDLYLLAIASVSCLGIGFLSGWLACCEIKSRQIDLLNEQLKRTKKALGTVCKEVADGIENRETYKW
ncbi:hypothetical protein [Zavarzinella formosa]|uniref:hypothetical protein n=1 Tax=Zavarzinella formosa TaxID=360055 RepID=UPI0002EFE390|nr:hypothetical protein [Zavarzinella formosa]